VILWYTIVSIGPRLTWNQTQFNKVESRPRSVHSSYYLLATDTGQPVIDRFEKARTEASEIAMKQGNKNLAERLRAFQLRDIRAKAASDIESLKEASDLLGHSEQQITKTVYRRKGQLVKPVR